MSSLIEAARSHTGRRRGGVCVVRLLTLDHPDRADEIVELFALPLRQLTHVALADALRSEGLADLGHYQVSPHRRGQCACPAELKPGAATRG